MSRLAAGLLGLIIGAALGAGGLSIVRRGGIGGPAAPFGPIAEPSAAKSADRPAYLVVLGEVYDREAFMSGYTAKLPPIYEKYGGVYLAAGRNFELFEGEAQFKSFVISKWPSMDAARAFWRSPEYDALRRARIEGNWGRFDVFALEGLAEASASPSPRPAE